MKKIISLTTVCALTAGLLVGCGGSSNTTATTAAAAKEQAAAKTETQAAAKPDKVYEIKLVTSNASTDPTVVLFYEYAAKIKELTNGGVDIQVYPGGEILMGDEGIQAIMDNAAVITFNDVDCLGDYVPELHCMCASYLFDDYKTIEAFTETEVFDKISKKSDDANVHLIVADIVTGARDVIADGVEVYSRDDVGGLNIRVPNVASYVDAWTAIGGNFTPLGFVDGISAIQTGMLNGLECTTPRVVDEGLDQVLKNPVYSMIQWRLPAMGFEIGAGYWYSLPEEYQNIITEQFEEMAHVNNQRCAEVQEEYLQKMEAAGVKIIRPEEIDMDSFKAALEPINKEFPMWDEVSAAVDEIIAAKQK